jgi:hypothetical protein
LALYDLEAYVINGYLNRKVLNIIPDGKIAGEHSFFDIKFPLNLRLGHPVQSLGLLPVVLHYPTRYHPSNEVVTKFVTIYDLVCYFF